MSINCLGHIDCSAHLGIHVSMSGPSSGFLSQYGPPSLFFHFGYFILGQGTQIKDQYVQLY